MNKQPNTFELAQLAAQLHGEPNDDRANVRRAMKLWQEAEQELEQAQRRHDYLKQLVTVIYDATPDEWQLRRKNYPGEQAEIDTELLRRVSAAEVQKQLFKNKNISKETRKKFFGSLALYAKNHGMAPPPIITKLAERSEPDPSLPYYDAAIRPQYKIKDVVSRVESWPKDEKFAASASQNLETCVDVSLHTVRWAVEVRQRQVAENKTRVIPASLRGKREDQMNDTTQYKRKFTA